MIAGCRFNRCQLSPSSGGFRRTKIYADKCRLTSFREKSGQFRSEYSNLYFLLYSCRLFWPFPLSNFVGSAGFEPVGRFLLIDISLLFSLERSFISIPPITVLLRVLLFVFVYPPQRRLKQRRSCFEFERLQSGGSFHFYCKHYAWFIQIHSVP